MSASVFNLAREWISELQPFQAEGQVRRVTGMVIEATTPPVFIGELCYLHNERLAAPLPCEVIGVRDDSALLMPYDYCTDIRTGTLVSCTGRGFSLPFHPGWLGRVVDALGRPLDGKGPLPRGASFAIERLSPSPLTRPRIRERLGSGVKALDAFATWGKGQRLGILAGSGVGKSTLFGMIARYAASDVNVIALIGERGREVKEFIERDLGEEGLKRSVVIAVPSDQSPLLRVKGAQAAVALAEYFRDGANGGQGRGQDVLLMMDSLTRFAYAMREIGLNLGEPPATRGYTPSVYAAIPRLCERAGMSEHGSITALFTVLVEADDNNEPVADIARSVLDGHIVLSRRLLTSGQLPPIDVLDSISRVMPEVVDNEHLSLAQWARSIMATYRDAEDLINIGAYQVGNNPRIDQAIRHIEHLRSFMRQGVNERVDYETAITALREALEDRAAA